MSVINLTEARIRDLEFGSGIWRDEQVKGLLVICHAKTKTYAAQGDVRRNGRHIRTVRVKIDRVDRIGLREARNRARTIMSQIQSGVDPSAKVEETGITLKQVLEEHLSERPLRPSTEVNYRYAVDTYLVRFRGRAVADITRTDVRDLFKELKEKRGTTTAGGAMRVLRALINTAMRIDESIKANPCEALRLPATARRHVAMLDIPSWWLETEKLSPIRRDLNRTMMLTGARRTSILNVKREDVDLSRRIILFRHMKVGDRMLLPIGHRLAEMLRARMEDDVPLGSEWLFRLLDRGRGLASRAAVRLRLLQQRLDAPPYQRQFLPLRHDEISNGGMPIEASMSRKEGAVSRPETEIFAESGGSRRPTNATRWRESSERRQRMTDARTCYGVIAVGEGTPIDDMRSRLFAKRRFAAQ